MSLEIGSKVQCWDENNHICIGWGKVIRMDTLVKENGEIPLIQLESGRQIWGDRCSWIEEKRAIEIGVRLFRDIHRGPGR